jgi:hypothetical protein
MKLVTVSSAFDWWQCTFSIVNQDVIVKGRFAMVLCFMRWLRWVPMVSLRHTTGLLMTDSLCNSVVVCEDWGIELYTQHGFLQCRMVS